MKFKIPKKFILGGIEHTVEISTKLEDNAYGWYNPNTATIALAQTRHGDKLSDSMMQQCFWHEVTHAVLQTMDNDLCKDESFVNIFASFLSGAINTME